MDLYQHARLTIKTRARQKGLELISPGERFVYQGFSLFENSTSVKDLKGFGPHTWGAGASGLMTLVSGF